MDFARGRRMRTLAWWLGLGLAVGGTGCAGTGVRGQEPSAQSQRPPLPIVRRQDPPPSPNLRIDTPPTMTAKAEPTPALQLTQGQNPPQPMDSPKGLPAVQTQLQGPKAEGPMISPSPNPPKVMETVPATGADISSLERLRQLQKSASERYANMDSYIIRLRRTEQINGKNNPEELMLLKFRKQPFSVYFRWLGPEAKGREVVYVKGMYEGKLHTLLAAGDVPLMPAGKRMAFMPDSALVRSSSRHAIYEAGIGNLIEKYSNILNSCAQGENRYGTLRYVGPVSRSEFPAACEAAEQTIPPGAEAQLPKGGRRLWAFDPVTNLPALIITQDDKGQQVEYYCYDRLQCPVQLDEDDFNPEKLGQPKRSDLPH